MVPCAPEDATELKAIPTPTPITKTPPKIASVMELNREETEAPEVFAEAAVEGR
jgi:hypothetical protein